MHVFLLAELADTIALLDYTGNTGTWVWGSLDSGLNNSECQISAIAGSGLSYSVSADGLTATLTLNITFLSALPGGTNRTDLGDGFGPLHPDRLGAVCVKL